MLMELDIKHPEYRENFSQLIEVHNIAPCHKDPSKTVVLYHQRDGRNVEYHTLNVSYNLVKQAIVDAQSTAGIPDLTRQGQQALRQKYADPAVPSARPARSAFAPKM